MHAAPPLRVAADCRSLVGNWTGIGIYTYGILAALARRGDVEIVALVHRPVADKGELAAHPRVRWVESAAPLGLLWQHLTLPRLVRESGAHVFWAALSTLPQLGIPAVVTLHDLTAWLFPELHPLKNKLSFNMLIHRSLPRATRIAAVSEHTRADFERHFPELAGAIAVVPPGVDDFFAPASGSDAETQAGATRERFAGGREYFLYLGTLEPRKNVPRLIDAYGELVATRGGLAPSLVLAGGRGWGAAAVETWRRRSPARDRIHLTGYVTREEKRDLYRAALAFVYPSLYEGFGLPPLEAMACGTPTLVAAAASLPEVVGAGAAVFPPGSTPALAASMDWMLANPDGRERLARAGLARAREYSWERAGAAMAQIFRDAAGVAGEPAATASAAGTGR